ncbi:hypothetical protein ACN47E_001956 [Coniothyrium glycines]
MPSKKIRDRKRQSKIDFSGASKSSPATKSKPSSMGNETSRPAQSTSKKGRRHAKPPKQTTLSMTGPSRSTSEDDLAIKPQVSIRTGAPTRHGIFDRADAVKSINASSEEDEEPISRPTSRKRRRVASEDESEEEEEEEPTLTVVSRKRQRRSDPKPTSSSPQKHMKHKRSKKQSTPEDDEPLTPPPVRSVRRRTIRRSPSVIEDDDDDDEEEELITPRRSKPGRRKSVSNDDDDEELHIVPRARRRIARRKALPSAEEDTEEEAADKDDHSEDGEEQDELKEDLAFLRSSPLPDRGRLRSTQDKPKSKRQEALEALKRRRAGTNEPSSSATPGRKRHIVEDSDSDSGSELEVIKEEPDSDVQVLEDDDEDSLTEEDRDANALDMFQEDKDDEGFIDDDEGLLGGPSADLDELRLNINLSKAKPRDLFKHAVEWMVMKKIHPGFDSNKIIYTITFRKLDDEVKGLAGSKFTSSTWARGFTQALKARPDYTGLEVTKGVMGGDLAPHCAACNRSGHTASWEVMLSGAPYNSATLEPLDQDSDSDSDSDSSSSSSLSADAETRLNGEKPTYNEAGERIPPESHRFMLGSTCQANAQVSHTLHHWRYHLYSWVKTYLRDQGLLTAEKLVWRENRSHRKREKEAQRIVDTMEETGEVRKLYRSYKDQVTFAMEVSNEYKDGWGRRR